MGLAKNPNFIIYIKFENGELYLQTSLDRFWKDMIASYEKRYKVTICGYICCHGNVLDNRTTVTDYAFHPVTDVPFHHYFELSNPNNLHVFLEKTTRELYAQYKFYNRETRSLITRLTPIYLLSTTKYKKHQANIRDGNLGVVLKDLKPYKLQKSVYMEHLFEF